MFEWTHHSIGRGGFWSGRGDRQLRAVLKPADGGAWLVVVWADGRRPAFRAAADAVAAKRTARELADTYLAPRPFWPARLAAAAQPPAASGVEAEAWEAAAAW